MSLNNGAKLSFVTGNANKLKEVQAILLDSQGHLLEIEPKDYDLPEIQGTTQEIAKEKCRAAARLVNGPCIVEDTALCFKAMNGLPGPYIKFFLREVGLNNMLVGFSTKEAWALCTFAYSSGPEAEPILFEGRTDGTIVPARGTGNFGWDSIFQAENTSQTYAEMDPLEKNKISHRYRALNKMREYLMSENVI
ncbi:hypothetical protein HETIRDRAFT_314162 [Heterobasidion irregulare TC 32-1]|uniref:Inosine triphosphate pyrophosphatase n=1 Tax=Heterobasidion irregulare (strain TC 32-1) TaxID=747525 RepID=W4KFW8_HETIT|nr:uncharacterized protein HETIRDRAFT_314162 [Heterobasidion irregulare TC 32-1]ETW84205.1 hypothetical protein HETIRDRAFT_314162 [Heterobasidion irregulare TC 32-1]